MFTFVIQMNAPWKFQFAVIYRHLHEFRRFDTKSHVVTWLTWLNVRVHVLSIYQWDTLNDVENWNRASIFPL